MTEGYAKTLGLYVTNETTSSTLMPDDIQRFVSQKVTESQKEVPDSVKLYANDAAEKAREKAIGSFVKIGAGISFLTLVGVWGLLQTSVNQKFLDELQGKRVKADKIIASLEAADKEAQDIRSRLAPLKVQQDHISDTLQGQQTVTRRVDFPPSQPAFSDTPKIMIALTYFDALPGGSVYGIRLGVRIVKSDSKGFEYEFNTCCGTAVGTVRADWIAIGK